MFCVKCQQDVYYCTCPDINERLAALADHPNWAIAWCNRCNRALAQCDCLDTGQGSAASMRTGNETPNVNNVAVEQPSSSPVKMGHGLWWQALLSFRDSIHNWLCADVPCSARD